MNRRARRLLWSATTIYWVLIFIATHLPPRRVPKLRVGDKTEHFVGYAILASLLMLVLPMRLSIRMVAVVLICAIYGAFDEWTQPIMGRTTDVRDWLADVGGAMSAVVLCWLIARLVSRSRWVATGRHLPLAESR